MRLAGIGVILGGWLIAVGGLLVTSSTLGRAVLACVGISLSLFGVLGVLNNYYLARAIWKK